MVFRRTKRFIEGFALGWAMMQVASTLDIYWVIMFVLMIFIIGLDFLEMAKNDN